jgi:cell division protease FtsH
VSLDDLATVTAGMSGADLANVLNEAAIMAARAGRPVIGADDLAEGHLRAIAGAERHDSPLAAGEREVIAYHEAGHCLAAELCPTHMATQRVSIRARGGAAGLALYGQTDRSLHSPQDVHERMLVALAGRAAEEITMGQVSSGAANDLEVVNSLARQAVSTLGFSTAIGQLQGTDVSDDTRRRIDAEVTRMVAEAYGDALDLLTAHRDELEAMAEALLELDELTRDQIDDIIRHRTPVRRPRRVAARVGRPPSVAPVAARSRRGRARPLRAAGAAAWALVRPVAALRPRRRIRSLL